MFIRINPYLCHLLTRYQSTIFPNHKSCVRKKGVPDGHSPFLVMEGANWNTEERFITHPAQFPVRLFLIGLQVSDLVMQSVIFFLYALEFLFLFFWLAFYLAFRWRKVLYAVIMYEGESCITTHLHV